MFNGYQVGFDNIQFAIQWTNNTATKQYYSPNSNITFGSNIEVSDPTHFNTELSEDKQPLVINSDGSYVLNLNGMCQETVSPWRSRIELSPYPASRNSISDYVNYTYNGQFKLVINNNLNPTNSDGNWPDMKSLVTDNEKQGYNNNCSITFFQILNENNEPVIEFWVGWYSGYKSSEGPYIGAFIKNPASGSKYVQLSEISESLITGSKFSFTLNFMENSIDFIFSIDESTESNLKDTPAPFADIRSFKFDELGLTNSSSIYIKQGAYCQEPSNSYGEKIPVDPPSLSWDETMICSLTVLKSQLILNS